MSLKEPPEHLRDMLRTPVPEKLDDFQGACTMNSAVSPKPLRKASPIWTPCSNLSERRANVLLNNVSACSGLVLDQLPPVEDWFKARFTLLERLIAIAMDAHDAMWLALLQSEYEAEKLRQKGSVYTTWQ